MTECKIAIGKNPADGKWYATCTFPDGKVLSTNAYDTHEECKTTIEEFLRSRRIKYTWRSMQ